MPKRIQMSRQRPWRSDNPDAIVVARPSRWGNPFPVDIYGLELSLRLFRDTVHGIWSQSNLAQSEGDEYWALTHAAHVGFTKRIGYHPLEAARSELRGHDLACWCPPEKQCHADILLGVANAT